MMNNYTIVQWPESQYFLGRSDCHLICDDIGMSKYGSSAYFVPQDVYDRVMGNEHRRSIIWSTIDVLNEAKANRMLISEYEAELLLDKMVDKHDASIGICWDTINVYLHDVDIWYSKELFKPSYYIIGDYPLNVIKNEDIEGYKKALEYDPNFDVFSLIEMTNYDFMKEHYNKMLDCERSYNELRKQFYELCIKTY